MFKKSHFSIEFIACYSIQQPCFGLSYYGYDDWGGTWHDVNKTYVGDSNLCWAAAAANILDWAGYDTTTYTTETAIFKDFKDHWTNQGSLPVMGGLGISLGWSRQPRTGWASVDVDGGDENWPGVSIYDVYADNCKHNLNPCLL